MKFRKIISGYTIVELLVVITVMGMISVGAVAAVQGQLQRTEFSQAVRDLETRLVSVASDTFRGYFPDTSQNIECTASNTGISFATVGAGLETTQGGSRDCIFIGKVIAFEVDGTESTLDVYTLAGRRQLATGRVPSDISQYQDGDIGAVPDMELTFPLLSGMRVRSVRYGSADIGMIGYISGISNREQQSSAIRFTGTPDIAPRAVVGTSSPPTSAEIEAATSSPMNYQSVGSGDSIEICVEQGEGGRRASIFLGRESRALTTTVEFDTSCGD